MTVNEYNQCVDDFADGVYRFILKNIKGEDNARDIVQDAFTKMWEKVQDISYARSKSYLFTAAYHTMIDFIRKHKKVDHIEELLCDGLVEKINDMSRHLAKLEGLIEGKHVTNG